MVVKRKIKLITLISVCAFSCTAIFCAKTFADSSSTDQGGDSGGNNSCTTGACYSRSYGGGWKRYPVTSNSIEIPGEKIDPHEFHGGTLSECQTVGATDYLRLAPSLWANKGKTHLRQLGLMTVGTFFSEGWLYRPDVDGITLSAAYKAFLAADAADGVRDGLVKGNTWNNVSAFCYKPGDENITHDGDTQFWTKSRVTVDSQYITGGRTVTSAKNGEAMLRFSTDETSVTVDFSHIVGFDHGSFTMDSKDTTSGDTVTTKWSIDGVYNVGEHSSSTWRPDSDHEEIPDATKKSVTISFRDDEYGSKTKCSTIKYTRRNVKLIGKPVIMCANGACWIDHYDYSSTYSGQEDSKVCVEVTRPEPPSGEPQNPGGNANSQVMFVGEDAAIQWNNIHAQSEETRRLSGWQSIKFQVGANVPYNQENFKVADVKADPCSMYRARFGITDSSLCVVHESGSWDTATSSKHSHDDYKGKEAYIKVPDYVGYKYCHSFGYSLEYWYGIEGSENAQENGWHHDAPKDYWHNFSAACRTIAKKPTTATWNGNIMTMGNIITSLANRHNSIIFGETSDAGDKSYTLYGSWSEYLTIANAELNSKRTMASGSTLSLGSANAELCKNGQSPWESNSPLTIANIDPLNPSSCKLGPSGIASNTTFITRLNAYLRDVGNKNGITSTNNVNDLYGEIQGNVVLSVEGDLNIDQNIIINDNKPYTINNVPQAIIFVKNGNVNIAENVNRIDAWLIVTASDNSKGTINTCANFTPGAPNSANVTSDGVGFNGSHCTKQLAFSGPVIARSMNLQRTYGSEAIDTQRQGTFSGVANSKQAPAEIFNLRADSYLWAYAQAARYNSSYSEAYSRELAPRY